MMSPLLCAAVALSALGLLIMLGAAAAMPGRVEVRWPSRLFDTGYGIFCLALTLWLIVAGSAFFFAANVHAA